MNSKAGMMIIEMFYGLPYCSTCVKAEQYLRDKGASIVNTVNVKETPVDETTLIELSTALGGVEALFSKRAMKYRASGLHEKQLSDADMLRYMQEEYTFIKRPVIKTRDGRVLAGFSARQYDKLFSA